MTQLKLSRPSSLSAVAGLALLLCAGCSHPERVEISKSQRVSVVDPVKPGATSADRFDTRGPAPKSGSGMSGDSVTKVLQESLEWDVPEGWQELSAGGMRIASLRPAGDADADCSLIILEGGGGGLEGNVNRWRAQLGLGPLSGPELEALPSQVLLGQRGVLVDFTGTYTGMGGPERPNWRLRGVILPGDDFTMFLKMTAPAVLAEAEEAAFDQLCASIRLKDAGNGAARASSNTGATPGPLGYAVPAGWADQGPKSMRAVNLSVGSCQCYVILLGGEAGGLIGNLNRWRKEVGLEPIGDADVSDLESVAVLGAEAPLLDVRGDYAGMGEEGGANYRVFGVALIRDSVSVFVKMVGPEAEMAAQRGAFLEFVQSLEEKQ